MDTEKKVEVKFVPKIYKICLTGGPCGGKTSASTMLKEKLGDKFILYFLPEVAAATVMAGVVIIPSEFTPDTHTVFTQGIMEMQMNLEDYFYKIATIQKKDVIIISDRGCIDNLAYCTPEVKERVLKENGWTMEKIRDTRYDAVIHLVTAADGAEKFYTLENNQARSETPEVAMWVDKRTQSVWNGHPNYRVISNTAVTSFQHKIDEVYKFICKVLHLPEQPTLVTKYLIKGQFDISKLPEDVSYERHTEEFHFLPTNSVDEEVWVKKRTSAVSTGESFIHTRRKLSKVAAERLELTRIIDHRQYEDDVRLADKSKKVVTKDVINFVYQNNNYTVENLTVGDKHVSILRAYTFDVNNVVLPPFIEVEEEVTENLQYSTSNIAAL
jgi:hypothetical protein